MVNVIKKFLNVFLRIVMITVLLGATYYSISYLMDTKPKARKKEEEKKIFVRTQVFENMNHQTEIKTMGSVIPSQKIDLYSKVGGEIRFVSPSFALGDL